VSFYDVIELVILMVSVALPATAAWLSVRWAAAWNGFWRVAALVPVIVLIGWIAAVVWSWPTEHTLWPLEMPLYGAALLVYLGALRGARGLARKPR